MRPPHIRWLVWVCVLLSAGWTQAAAGPSAPHRIVSTFLCTDEYVFRLAPRDRIAALSYLAADTRPVVSTIAGRVKGIRLVRASAEQVLRLHPDLVVTYRNTNLRQTQLLRAAGVKVLELPWAQSLADVRRITRMLGARLGKKARAAALLARMDEELRAARATASRPPVRTLIYEPNGYAIAGGVSDEILAAAGLRDIAPSAPATRSGTLPVETVLSLAPELLILNGEHELRPARADLVLKNPALAALKGKTSIVHANLTPLLCPGPWSADVAGQLARWGRQVRALARTHARS